MKSTLYAAAIALASALSPRAQAPAQVVDASIGDLGGNWVTSEAGDLAASAAGESLTYSWTDSTGLADVEIVLRVNWRHYAAVQPCSMSLNGIDLGALAEDRLLEAQADTVHAGEYFIHVPLGAYSANGVNEFALTFQDDAGGSASIGQPEGEAYALQFTIQAAGTADAIEEADAQQLMIEVPLASLEGDFANSGCGGDDRSAYEVGKSVSAAWMDTKGFTGIVELNVEINWRFYQGAILEGFFNGVALGRIDQAATFECMEGVFFPTAHHFRLPEGAYLPNGLNRFTLTLAGASSTHGAAIGICEPLERAVAMRFIVRPYVEEQQHESAPAYPQAVVLMDSTTGLILESGVAIDSPDLRLVAVLADPDGDSAFLLIEYRNVDTDETGVFVVRSQKFEPGTQVSVSLPALGPGTWLIRVRAIDSTGRSSDWVPVNPAVRVTDFGQDQLTEGVDRAEVEALTAPVADPEPIIVMGGGSGGSGGGSCSAGAGSAYDAALIGFAALLILGAARRRM